VRLIALILFGIAINFASVSSARADGSKEAERAARVKDAIVKLGTGPAARVELKLRDGQKFKGYVSETSEDSFLFVGDDGAAKKVPYPQVKHVKGNNLSTGAKIAIGAGVAIVVLILVFKDHIMAY